MVHAGVIWALVVFIGFLFLNRVLSKAYRTNPLLGIGGMYLYFQAISNQISGLLPESWNVKQIENLAQIDGDVGILLYPNEPKMSAFNVASATFSICLIGNFIYALTSKRKTIKTRMEK